MYLTLKLLVAITIVSSAISISQKDTNTAQSLLPREKVLDTHMAKLDLHLNNHWGHIDHMNMRMAIHHDNDDDKDKGLDKDLEKHFKGIHKRFK